MNIKNYSKTLNLFIKLGFNTASIGWDLNNKLILSILPFLIYLNNRILKKHYFEIPIKIRSHEKCLDLIITSWVDFVALREIFVDKQYEFKMEQAPSVIFDLGGHIGLSTLYFNSIYPGAKIHVFEPDPNNFKVLKKNLKGFANITVNPTAISFKDDVVEFFFNKTGTSITSSLIKTSNGDQVANFVETKSINSYMVDKQIEKIDLLKVDIEGGESSIFDSSTLSKIDTIIGELHFDLMDKSEEEFMRPFYERYSRVSMKPLNSNRYILNATK